MRLQPWMSHSSSAEIPETALHLDTSMAFEAKIQRAEQADGE
jgi:hypothetical protein